MRFVADSAVMVLGLGLRIYYILSTFPQYSPFLGDAHFRSLSCDGGFRDLESIGPVASFAFGVAAVREPTFGNGAFLC